MPLLNRKVSTASVTALMVRWVKARNSSACGSGSPSETSAGWLSNSAQTRLTNWRTAVQRPVAPAADELIAGLRAALRADLDAPAALALIDAWADADGNDPDAAAGVAEAIDALLDRLLGADD